MDYDRILLEMLDRIKILEEKVDALTAKQAEEPPVIKTADIVNHILKMKETAKGNGDSFLEIKANDIHKALHLKNRMPAVCTAMKKCMMAGDLILHETPSGFSSTFEVKYFL